MSTKFRFLECSTEKPKSTFDWTKARISSIMRFFFLRGTDESGSCVIVFLIVYFFLMSGIIWFDILSYSWFLMFKALGSYQDPLAGMVSVGDLDLINLIIFFVLLFVSSLLLTFRKTYLSLFMFLSRKKDFISQLGPYLPCYRL